MIERLQSITVTNYRCLANASLTLGNVCVLFGPNGSGKTAILDAIRFVADCATRGVDYASSTRGQGVGLLWDKAPEGTRASIGLETGAVRYELRLGFSSGRIERRAGEQLHSTKQDALLIERGVGEAQAKYRVDVEVPGLYLPGEYATVALRDPDGLALLSYADRGDWEGNQTAQSLVELLRSIKHYPSRQFALSQLKTRGSESSYESHVWENAENLWSVLRNLHDRRSVDSRYDTIIEFMRKAFPTFQEMVFVQTGPTSVYAEYMDSRLSRPIPASDLSDGHLHLLILLAALFCVQKTQGGFMLFDEPETSLHPFATAVLAEAVKLAGEEWNKQILIATHSPVLLSQFETSEIIATECTREGGTNFTRVNEIPDIQDLLDRYAAGSLYMAEILAPQSQTGAEEERA